MSANKITKTITISQQSWDMAEVQSKSELRSISNLIELALLEYLKKKRPKSIFEKKAEADKLKLETDYFSNHSKR